jgi:hypothetical protein
VIEGAHLVELDEAHRLPELDELAKRFVVLDGMPPALRPLAAVRDSVIAEAFTGTIIRYAWMDRHPRSWSSDRLRTAARDSVIRYAMHHKLTFKFTHDQWGERWTWNEDQGCWQPTGVYGWSSEATITGREQR